MKSDDATSGRAAGRGDRGAPAPSTFRRFMEVALYHPEHGYYRRPARSVRQAGRLLHRRADPARLRHAHGRAHPPTLSRHGRAAGFHGGRAGRRTRARWPRRSRSGATSPWISIPASCRRSLRGVVFSNEFFDALPVEVARLPRRRVPRAARGCSKTGASSGRPAARCVQEVGDICAAGSRRPRKAAGMKPTSRRSRWMERIGRALGCRLRAHRRLRLHARRSRALPGGTLMAYRRHIAREDVLEDPGERDITAHVNFTALEECGAACGLRQGALRDAGANAARRRRSRPVRRRVDSGPRGHPDGELRRRMQLKTLLFGMGETFRVLLQQCGTGNRREKPETMKKAPETGALEWNLV